MKRHHVFLFRKLEKVFEKDIHDAYVVIIMRHVPMTSEGSNVVLPRKKIVEAEILNYLMSKYDYSNKIDCLKEMISKYVTKKYEVINRVTV